MKDTKDIIKKESTDLETASSKEVAQLVYGEACVILIDNSGSMNNPCTSGQLGSRMTAAKKALTKFTKAREASTTQEDVFAVIEFNSISEIASSFQANFPSRYKAIDRITATGGTQLDVAYDLAFELLRLRDEELLRIIVLSDGLPLDEEEALEKGKMLFEDYGIVSDTISVSTGKDCTRYLNKLASVAGGSYSLAVDDASLDSAFLEYEQERKALMGCGVLYLEAPKGNE